jgi:hypothetical protein
MAIKIEDYGGLMLSDRNAAGHFAMSWILARKAGAVR